MHVRPATASDIPAMLDLERRCPASAHWSQQQYEDLFRKGADISRRVILVADNTTDAGERAFTPAATKSSEGPMLGFLIANQIGPEWELENIAVDPTSRRKGAATRLFAVLRACARETNSESVFLEVRESNRAARALYSRLEFQETGRRKLYYANPPEDAVLYRLTLAQHVVK